MIFYCLKKKQQQQQQQSLCSILAVTTVLSFLHHAISGSWCGYVSQYTGICHLTAACLAQLVERRTAVREVDGSSPRPDQHSGS